MSLSGAWLEGGRTNSYYDYWTHEVILSPYMQLVHELRAKIYKVIDECKRRHDFRRDNVEIGLEYRWNKFKSQLEYELLELEKHGLPLANLHLGDDIDIDSILKSEVERKDEEENFVMYEIDGDEVTYFVMNSFKPDFDFIFPSNTFNPSLNLNLRDSFRIDATFVVDFPYEFFVSSTWFVVPRFAQFLPCRIRRRTKGALAQPFDSLD